MQLTEGRNKYEYDEKVRASEREIARQQAIEDAEEEAKHSGKKFDRNKLEPPIDESLTKPDEGYLDRGVYEAEARAEERKLARQQALEDKEQAAKDPRKLFRRGRWRKVIPRLEEKPSFFENIKNNCVII